MMVRLPITCGRCGVERYDYGRCMSLVCNSPPQSTPQAMGEWWFTLVFEGDIRSFKTNPLRTETTFGVPYAVSTGNALAELDNSAALIETLKEALRGVKQFGHGQEPFKYLSMQAALDAWDRLEKQIDAALADGDRK